MKNLLLIIIATFLMGPLQLCVGQSVPFPTPGHEGLNTKKVGNFVLDKDKDLQIGLWTQSRVMYNYSNIPGPGGTNFDSTANYDFFRQRVRIGLDISMVNDSGVAKSGTYIQLEYRGGWGGSSPTVSDPRGGAPVNNAFNFIQARGIRYGFVYYKFNERFNVAAGILPLSDQLGSTLFDAEHDFNTGGITAYGKIFKGNYRLGIVRLIDGVGANSNNSFNYNSNMYLLDYNFPISPTFEVGMHVYGIAIPSALAISQTKNEAWFGFNAKAKFDHVVTNGFIILNNGTLSDQKHTGLALKLEGIAELGKSKLSIEGFYTSGDNTGKISKRFVTPLGIFGTWGYWGYNNIFTPNGPSDVNDLGLEIGNNGAGLTTIQSKLDFPIVEHKLDGQVFGGWFGSDR